MTSKKNVVRVTILGDEYSVRSDASPERMRAVAEHVDNVIRETMRAGNIVEGVNRAGVKELAIGNFKLANAEVVVAHVSSDILLSKSAAESNAGVLGEDYLSTNFAVIDMGGRALYLRRPDSR